MLAPAKPPRVASNVAPVTRVSVRAARGIAPAASPIPFSVLRFDSAPEPRIDGPSRVIVTFDIVPAIALRSPAIVGEICAVHAVAPLLAAIRAPGCVGFTRFDARTGFDRGDLHRGEHRDVARQREVGDELALGGLPLHASTRGLEARRR